MRQVYKNRAAMSRAFASPTRSVMPSAGRLTAMGASSPLVCLSCSLPKPATPGCSTRPINLPQGWRATATPNPNPVQRRGPLRHCRASSRRAAERQGDQTLPPPAVARDQSPLAQHRDPATRRQPLLRPRGSRLVCTTAIRIDVVGQAFLARVTSSGDSHA